MMNYTNLCVYYY